MKKGFQALLSVCLCALLLLTAAVPAFAALGTVKKLVLADTTPTSVSLKWSAVSGAKTYELQQLKSGAWKKVTATANRTYTVKGLKMGSTYAFRVRAVKGSSFGGFSKTLNASPAPAKVSGLSCAAKSMTAVKLSWKKQSGVTGYRVQQYINGQWTVVVKKTSGTTAKIKNLEPGTTYKFRVCAYQKVGGKNYFGAYCTRLAVKTAAVGVPTGLKATKVTDSAVVLQWNKVSGVKEFVIYSVNGNSRKRLGAAEKNAFTVKNLAGGTDYIFTVISVIRGTERNFKSKYSDNLSVRTAPAAVKNFKASDVGAEEVTLSWSKSKNAQNYRVYQVVNDKWKTLGNTTRTTYTIDGLEELTSYQFRVRPYLNNAGKDLFGPYSSILNVKTSKASVKGLKATSIAEKSIVISWDAMVDATGYTVETSTDNKNFTAVSAAPATAGGTVTATITNLAGNTTYYIRVSAKYANGTGLPAKLTVRTAPTKTQGLKATGISGGISLSWNPTPGADGYEVSKSTNSNNWEVVSDVLDTTTVAENLPVNVQYFFRVRAYYSENGVKYYGDYSEPAISTALPPSVKDLTASGVTTTSFNVTWTKQADANNYKISIASAGGSFTDLPNNVTYNGDKASIAVTGRTAGTEYTVQVCAMIGGTLSAPSTITVKTVPAKVTGLSASATSGSEISLRWTAVTGAETYEIQQRTNGGEFATIGTAKEIPHVVSGLSPMTEYHFRVRAVNTTGGNAQQGEFSAEAIATTTSAPSVNPTPTDPTPTDPTPTDPTPTDPTPTNPTPSNPTTPGGRTPTTSNRINGVKVLLNETGNSYTMTWDEVENQNAKYAVEMKNPATNQWEELSAGSLWPRVFSNMKESDLGVKCTAGSDSATNVSWNAASGASKYEVRSEVSHGTGKWLTGPTSSSTSATLRLAPNYRQTVRVSAIGSVTFRIFALDISDESKQLAYSETTQTVYVAYDDFDYTTPAVGALSASSSAGDKEAYVLMLAQAVNNTRYETGKLTMNAETELKSSATMLGETAEDKETSTTTCTFNNASGEATHTVTKSDGTKTTTKYTLWQYYAITPNAGTTYLYDQHNLASFQKGVKSVTATPNADGTTTVVIVLGKESFDASKKAIYHPGFLDSIADNGDQIAQYGNKAKISNASIGETTITAKINKNYTLDSYEIMNPFTMDVTVTLMLIPHTAPMVSSSHFKYTFTR